MDLDLDLKLITRLHPLVIDGPLLGPAFAIKAGEGGHVSIREEVAS